MTPSPQTDEALLIAVQKNGDQQAYAELVRRHSGRLYALAVRILRNRAEAEDILQETFLRLWQRPDRWNANHGSRVMTWLYRVTVNLCLDRCRKSGLRRHEDIDAWTDRLADPHTTADAEQKERLLAAIKTLTPHQRAAVELVYYEGMPQKEAAQIMDLSEKGLQSLLHRARTDLKKTMEASDEADNR